MNDGCEGIRKHSESQRLWLDLSCDHCLQSHGYADSGEAQGYVMTFCGTKKLQFVGAWVSRTLTSYNVLKSCMVWGCNDCPNPGVEAPQPRTLTHPADAYQAATEGR